MKKVIYYEIEGYINSKNINDNLCSLISNSLNCNKKDIQHNSCLAKDFGADSLDVVELIIDIEDEIISLDKQIPDEDIEFLYNVGIMNIYIESFMKKNEYSTEDIISYSIESKKKIKIKRKGKKDK